MIRVQLFLNLRSTFAASFKEQKNVQSSMLMERN